MDPSPGEPSTVASSVPRGSRGARARPRIRSAALAIGVALVLAGVSFAIASDATPGYHTTTLAVSGSFFALAASGSTLYAASDNGGSILLETSTDRGVAWSSNPVPYSAVAGGAPWDHAAVAVDGGHLILAAATGGPFEFAPFPSSPPPIPAATGLPSGTCGTNSTLLIASSPDGGFTWMTSSFVTPGWFVTSLQAGIEGDTAAVAWIGETTGCAAPAGTVQAVTSTDGGQSWSSVRTLNVTPSSVTTGEGLEMAPESQGILIGFGLQAADGTTQQLSLWQLANDSTLGFQNLTRLAAPTSWTLQGDPQTSAFLLTPTYLIPLTTAPYTAIPFNQLEQDSAGIGSLPRVVSLVASGVGSVEVAATTADNLGVDCWQVGWAHLTVTQSCHVPLGSWLTASARALPIVALIDGGGWWAAIGASGGCPGYCSAYGGPAAPSAGSAISTSVCVTGCSSAQGLEAYSYELGAFHGGQALGGWAPGIAGLGAVIVLGAVIIPARGRRAAPAPGSMGTSPGGAAAVPFSPMASERGAYLTFLAVWLAVWIPLALLAFGSGAGPVGTVWPVAVLGGGLVGIAVGYPIHRILRARLESSEGIGEAQLFGLAPSTMPGPGYDDVPATGQYAHASWVAAVAVSVLLWMSVASGTPASGAGPSTAAWLLLGGLGVFLALRFIYHRGLARLVAAQVARSGGERRFDESTGSSLRTGLGAALLPLNPLAGLVLGVGLDAWFPDAPYFLALGFLPVTLLGIALLSGGFGRTVWTPRFLTGE
jgi:hypothetical protein